MAQMLISSPIAEGPRRPLDLAFALNLAHVAAARAWQTCLHIGQRTALLEAGFLCHLRSREAHHAGAESTEGQEASATEATRTLDKLVDVSHDCAGAEDRSKAQAASAWLRAALAQASAPGAGRHGVSSL
eukprot:CAMPEP_0170569214 /NCGR_PEP_ID=MMETSP0224-20130122/413_1 /TAXON_ID=285029 /ORGANISM="Togula jolla, Strain CCCM 725" /LENGTH=129 /DNA_ID=CAMNT_0010891321 /DNA_START=83 /DNA_END=473 /DNA_ORIENTATION=-